MTETADLPLAAPARTRTILNAAQIIKASDWMKANAEMVRGATNATIAAELTVVLGTRVTENNITMLRDATGLHPRTAASVAVERLQVIERALEFLLCSDSLTPSEQTEAAKHRDALQRQM